MVPRVSGSHLFPAGRPTDKDRQWILMESKTTKSLRSVNKILLAWVILGVRSFILERIYSPSITPVQLVFLGFSIRCRPPALHSDIGKPIIFMLTISGDIWNTFEQIRLVRSIYGWNSSNQNSCLYVNFFNEGLYGSSLRLPSET